MMSQSDVTAIYGDLDERIARVELAAAEILMWLDRAGSRQRAALLADEPDLIADEPTICDRPRAMRRKK